MCLQAQLSRSLCEGTTIREAPLCGFCRVCRFRDVCRGGCSWGTYAQGGGGNEHCFYHQAVKHGRFDLLAEKPTAEERDYFERGLGLSSDSARQ